MNDNADDDLTEAQCRLIQVLTNGVWRRLKDHDPEVVANVISAVLAEFLSNWGTQHPPPLRRRIQVEIVTSLAQVTFDLLDVRAAKEGRRTGGPTKPH
jgi:hypothetical protein